ncbi:DUF3397 domain-containing protein [Lysinibacillus sphaericus]|uniref:Protein of uncharacterized function (DUF3397) n=3 Tax=Lysinibacillus TaxID=400634 RepID=A0A2S0K469_LYSSH|nr:MULTISPECIES: DUF3397 domain-containing protein [Lysinibacillus]AHN20800.1 hypothetical protein T479_04445 [Lysinibacillus varians]AVK98128.1 hypothetical protein LS41612_18420 [Lysinibacillus sphaericus]MED4543633.1 DUF3397 domain-containing protein [Lysinibacillus sphaericus]TKI19125.1 DUF3397 domain-containing protein [Lysinibacillus sphaericus]TKI48516.1 DUF3397 domain-containing protein [Lysinibacillus tabacifolii]
MKDILHIVISVIIFCPILLFVIVYAVSRKVNIRGTHAFGAASDVTTFWLFFSVPLAIGALWGVNVGALLVMLAIVLAIVFTYVDWRTKKEIEVRPLLRKIWRFLFLVLSTAYLLICLVGMIQSVVEYLQSV